MNILQKLFNRWLWKQPVQINYDARRKEMLRLRHEEGKTLKEIGEITGVSRERVRQIIGNTGREFRSSWTQKLVRSGKVILNHWTDLENAPGVKKVWRADWGNHRHVVVKEGNVKKGYDFENRASKILDELRIDHKMMPLRSPYNIELSNGAKINVCVTHTNIQKMETQNSNYPTWAVPIRGKNKWDFLFVFVPDSVQEYVYYIIPQNAVDNLREDSRIRIPHPPMSQKASRWHQYYKKIDLLLNFSRNQNA